MYKTRYTSLRLFSNTRGNRTALNCWLPKVEFRRVVPRQAGEVLASRSAEGRQLTGGPRTCLCSAHPPALCVLQERYLLLTRVGFLSKVDTSPNPSRSPEPKVATTFWFFFATANDNKLLSEPALPSPFASHGRRSQCPERHPQVSSPTRRQPVCPDHPPHLDRRRPLPWSTPDRSAPLTCPAPRKLVIIGDGACGKTSLLSVFTLGFFPTVSAVPCLYSLSPPRRSRTDM
jgi:hypothetical protein